MTTNEFMSSSSLAIRTNTGPSQNVCAPTAGADQKKGTQIRYYCDGAGAGPDGKGSGYAWLREDTGETGVYNMDGLTNNQAEYMAIRIALENVPRSSIVEILSDSELAIKQLIGLYRINDETLRDMYELIVAIIRERGLKVDFRWIPRRRNQADKLLAKKDFHKNLSSKRE